MWAWTKLQKWIVMLSYQSQTLEFWVFSTILEEIPLQFPRLLISGIDQSTDLDKDCDQFAWDEIRVIIANSHKVQLSLTLSL